MLLSVLKIYPSAGSEQSALDVLESVKGPLAALADCLACSVTVEVEEGGVICYMEKWRTREALDRHLRSPLYGRVLEAMECSQTVPEIEFYEVTEIGGIELIEQARSVVVNRMKERP